LVSKAPNFVFGTNFLINKVKNRGKFLFTSCFPGTSMSHTSIRSFDDVGGGSQSAVALQKARAIFTNGVKKITTEEERKEKQRRPRLLYSTGRRPTGSRIRKPWESSPMGCPALPGLQGRSHLVTLLGHSAAPHPQAQPSRAFFKASKYRQFLHRWI
jgi:hypothetical protein